MTTDEATTSGSATPAEPGDSGGSLVWLWITLALLVVAIAVAIAVTASRRRAQQLEQERLDREQELAALADANPPTWAGGTGAPYTSPADRAGYQPYDAGQSYGLLSGREGDGPALYSGQGRYRTDRPLRAADPVDQPGRAGRGPAHHRDPADTGGTPGTPPPATPPAASARTRPDSAADPAVRSRTGGRCRTRRAPSSGRRSGTRTKPGTSHRGAADSAARLCLRVLPAAEPGALTLCASVLLSTLAR